MINNSIKDLQLKINRLEKKIDILENKSQSFVNNLGFSVWTNNFLNLNIINQKQFLIKTISKNLNNNLFFQLRIKFLNYSQQEIKFDLLCNNIKIGSENNTFDNNIHEITVSGSYQNILSETIKVELHVNPKNSKQLTLINTTLTVWGIAPSFNEEYDALETESEYLLSYISNNRLYYKTFNKHTNSNDVDFIYLNEAISHSICKDIDDNIFLFYVDLSGNLFFRKFNNSHNYFISTNVNKVCSCIFNNTIYFAYITNDECYYGEILNNIVISNKKVTSIFGKFVNCYLYSDNKNNKCYMILSKENNSNYLLENISNNLCSSENISAEINLNISTGVDE